MPRPMMKLWLVVACVAVFLLTATPDAAAQPADRPTYQRRPIAGRPAFFPNSFQAGSFQRPYPYHLDYYRQRYQGGYEPYLGNLYGPPRVVGAQPFAYSPVPPQAGELGASPGQTAPLAAPYFHCPHCRQPIALPPQAPH